MATEKESSILSYCTNDPNFAIICSFFDRFSASCGISHPTFSDLQEMIENSQEVAPELIELHVKLLRKIRKSVSAEKWERALIKFCHSYYISEDGWELERSGYNKCKIPNRLRILKTLLDAQFDLNSKFKADINKLTAEELRIEPLGKDKVGQLYWCQFDPAANVRVYKEDLDEETWKLVAKDREDLVDLITQLSSGEELLGLELINEDSNSQEIEKPIIDTGQVEMTTSEENSTDTISNSNKIGNNERNNSTIDVSDFQKSSIVQKNVNSIETNTNTVQEEQIVLVKRETDFTNLDTTKVSVETSQSDDKNNKPVDDKDTKILVKSEDGKPHLDEAATNSLETNDSKSNTSNAQNTILDSSKVPNDMASIPAQTVSIIQTDCLLPGKISDTTNPPEASKLNVAEEIKQRVLCKSGVKQSLIKGKINKPNSGSKLDLIFGRKLEQDDSSKSLQTVFKSLEKPTDTNFGEGKSINEGSMDLSLSRDEFAQASSVNSESSCTESKSKRKPDEPNEQPSKKMCLDVEHEVGEEIEEPLMIIRGEGSGQDCDTGNPGTDSEKNVTAKENPAKKTCSSEVVNNQEINSSANENISVSDRCNDHLKNCESGLINRLVDSTSSDLNKSIEEQLSAITGESMSPKQVLDNRLEIDEKRSYCMSNTNVDKGQKLPPDTDPKNTAPPETIDPKNNKLPETIDPKNTKPPETIDLKNTISQETKENQILNDSIDIFGSEETTADLVQEKKTDQKAYSEECFKKDQDIVDFSNKGKIPDSEKDKADSKEIRSCNQISSASSLDKNCHVTRDGKIDSSADNISSIYKADNNSSDKIYTKELSLLSLEKDTKVTKYNTSLNTEPESDQSVLFHDKKETNDTTFQKKVEASILESRNSYNPNADLQDTNLCEDSKIIIKSHDNNIDTAKAENSSLQMEVPKENQSNSKDLPVKKNLINKGSSLKVLRENQSDSEEFPVKKDLCNKVIDSAPSKKSEEFSDTSPEKDLPNGNKKKSVSAKKLPKRKKLFSPRPKKKMNKEQGKSSTKETSEDKNGKKVVKAKIDQEEVKCLVKDKEEHTETSKKSKLSLKGDKKPSEIINRKRRNSRKNTGTEKDSDDDVSERNEEEEEEEEVGGKRRKMKGKRAPNKTLRKSIEEKKNLKSSSEDDSQPDDKKEKCSKKSVPSKLKSPTKIGKSNKDALSKPESENATKKKKEDKEASSKHPIVEKKKTPKPGGPNSRAFLGIDLNIDLNSTSRSVRQSSRLAQIKIKEQSDTKHSDEVHPQKDKSEKKSKRKKEEKKEKQKQKLKNKTKPKVESEDDETEEPEKKKGRKKKKEKKFVFNEKDPWKSSSGDSSDGEDEEEDHFEVEEEEYVPITVKSDHEFSPESDIESNEEVKPVRRARTAQKVTDLAEEKDANEANDLDDFACEKCSKKDHPEWILLCDTCDHGWHASCLRPSLMLVPEGDWHCPPCQHTVLVKQLHETLKIYDRDQKRRENEELRKKRLAYVGISLDNVLPSGHQPREKKEDESDSESFESSRSESQSDSEYSDEPVYQLRERRQGTTSYRFNEYDDLINSAIRDEVEGSIDIATATGRIPVESDQLILQEGEPKVASLENSAQVNGESTEAVDTKTKNEVKPKNKVKKGSGDDSSEVEDEDDEEEEEEFPSVVPKRNNVLPRPGKKKHRRLNCLDDPSDDDDGSDEDFRGSSSGGGEEEEEDDDDSDDSDIARRGRSRRNHMAPVRRSSRTRRSRIDKEFINDDSDESDAPRRKKKKKLWTESDSESDDSTWGKRKKKKSYTSSGRRKHNKNKKFVLEDELSESETSKTPKKKRQRKIKYGGLDDLAVEELPSRRTRGRAINYQEVIESDSDEDVKKKKTSKRAIIEDDEDEFVAEKEVEKHDSESSSDEEEPDGEEISSDDEENAKAVEIEEETKGELEKIEVLSHPTSDPIKFSPPKTVNKELVPQRRGRPPKAMIAPPPERLVNEDEKYKAIVSKVSTLGHGDQDINKSEINLLNPKNNSEPFEAQNLEEPMFQVTPIKMDNNLLDPKFIHRSPPIKIRSGVPVNPSGRRSPALVSPINETQYFPKSPSSGMVQSPPDRPQYPLPLLRANIPVQPQSSIRPLGSHLLSVKSEAFGNEDDGDDLDDDLIDDLEEEEDDSEDDVLEEGEIPKKMAKRMAREEERQQRLEEKRVAELTSKLSQSGSDSPGSAQPPTSILSEQKPIPTTQPSQPLLRVVSPLKLMANPPGPMQSTFMHSGLNPRMSMSSPPPARLAMPMRSPQPANMMPGMGIDETSSKRRGRGRGKKPPEQEKPIPEMMGGQSVIRGILQQPQSYPPSHYPQQYPPHTRIPFNPQRMPRPPFHPGGGQHLPLDPSPSGGGTVNVKQETGNHPQSNPVHIPSKPPHSSAPPYPPPPHRFDSGIPRQPSYPPQGNPQLKHPQYGSYPPPPAPSGNYHFGSYPPPIATREEPQVYPVQPQYNEQYAETRTAPPAAPSTIKAFPEEDSSEFSGLVSYFSSQQEENIDT